MRLSLFASSSSGNCALLSCGESHLLLDAGISLRRIRHSLAAHDLSVDDLSGVLLTHEHSDHTAGLAMLCKYHSPALYATRPTANYLCRCTLGLDGALHHITPGVPFTLGDFTVTPFPTPHDAACSVGYRIETPDGVSFGLCTDCGCVTGEMRTALRGCDAVVLEANHDVELLCQGSYPLPLKRRILSDCGHLSNADCAALAAELCGSGTHTLILGHLSQENNRPALSRRAVTAALEDSGCSHVRLEIAPVWGDLSLEVTAVCKSS